jgi:hypothetical protein
MENHHRGVPTCDLAGVAATQPSIHAVPGRDPRDRRPVPDRKTTYVSPAGGSRLELGHQSRAGSRLPAAGDVVGTRATRQPSRPQRESEVTGCGPPRRCWSRTSEFFRWCAGEEAFRFRADRSDRGYRQRSAQGKTQKKRAIAFPGQFTILSKHDTGLGSPFPPSAKPKGKLVHPLAEAWRFVRVSVVRDEACARSRLHVAQFDQKRTARLARPSLSRPKVASTGQYP